LKKIHLIREKHTPYGGAENYLSRLSNALHERGVDCEVLNSPFPSFLPSWMRMFLFDKFLCWNKKNKFYFSLERISCPDIYRAGDGVHKVFLENTNKKSFNPLHRVMKYYEKKCFSSARVIVANSQMVKSEIIQTYGISSKNIKVIYNGIPVKSCDYYYSYKKIYKEFSYIDSKKIILFVGSGFSRKGVDSFLKIISLLKTIEVIAFVIGYDKNINKYIDTSSNLGLRDIVNFIGPRDDVNDFYCISDFVILPSLYDPFSNVTLEAMNFGNVVFTSHGNGASELLDPEYVFRQGNEAEVSSKIKDLIIDDENLNSIKENNINIAKRFSIQRNMKQTLHLITKHIYD